MAADGKATDADASTSAARAPSTAVSACVLHFLARIVALVAVQLPLTKDGCPRLRPRRLILRVRRRRRRSFGLRPGQGSRRCLAARGTSNRQSGSTRKSESQKNG